MIPKDQVKRIAGLARLEMTEREAENMKGDLSLVLDYFALLRDAHTSEALSAAQSNSQIISLQEATRKDAVEQKSIRLTNALVQAAPDKKEGYIKVKTIL